MTLKGKHMKIVNHLLEGSASDKITMQATDKTSGKFATDQPVAVIIHFTAGRDAKSSVRTLRDPAVKASAHLVIGRDNSITQLVPFDTISWHAGRSSWGNMIGMNKYSIGIEIDNAGKLNKQGDEFLSWFGKSYKKDEVFEGVHRNEDEMSYWHRYTEKQIEQVANICRLLADTYNLTLILGHEEISPGRKVDPGPAFPLDRIRNSILYTDRQTDDPEEFQEETTQSFGYELGLVTASKLNVRSGPSLEDIKVSEPLTKGSLVKVMRKQGEWYKVKIEQEGWVNGKWLETDL